jgi:hypothetical protein
MPETARCRGRVVISGLGCLVGWRPGAGVGATLGQAQRVLVKPGCEIASRPRGADQYRRVQDGYGNLQQQRDRCEDRTKTARAAYAPPLSTETVLRQSNLDPDFRQRYQRFRRHRRSRNSPLRDGNQQPPLRRGAILPDPEIVSHRIVSGSRTRLLRGRPADPPHKKPTVAVRLRASVGLFLDAVASTFLGNNSRFGELNSRLGRANSRFVALREFAGKGLICLTVFATKRRLRAENG